MKKQAILLILAMTFMCGPAYGAAIDAGGEWLMSIPEQVKTLGEIVSTFPTYTGAFYLTINTSGQVHFIQRFSPDCLGQCCTYYNLVTTPPYSGTYVDNGDGTYDFDPNATTGWVNPYVLGHFPKEFTLHHFVYSDVTDFITDGIMTTYVDVSKIYGIPPGHFIITGNIYWTAERVPIPSAILLLGSGLIGLVGFRRKFRKP